MRWLWICGRDKPLAYARGLVDGTLPSRVQRAPRQGAEGFEELREGNRRGFRAVDHRFAIRAECRDSERHGDAVIAEGIQIVGVETLAAGNRDAIWEFRVGKECRSR